MCSIGNNSNGRGYLSGGEPRDLSSKQIALEVRRNKAAGVCCIPLISKDKPAVKWKEYQERFETDSEIDQWESEGKWQGVGAVCGEISGGLQALDFDLDASIIFPQYVRMVEDHRPGLIERLPIFRTPRGGYHLLFRCEVVDKAEKLALRAIEVEEKTPRSRLIDGKYFELWELIETRGRGNYLCVWPSRRSVHPSCKPYMRERGSLLELPTVTPNERDVLLGLARSFNEYVEPEQERAQYSEPGRVDGAAAGLRPGDDFNQRGVDLVEGLLLDANWTVARREGAVVYLRRPGKRKGYSATLHAVAPGVLYCFSSADDYFEALHGYSPFEIYTRLKHYGDHSATAKALAELGYGERRERKQSTGSGDSVTSGDCEEEAAALLHVTNVMLSRWGLTDEEKVTYYAKLGLMEGKKWRRFGYRMLAQSIRDKERERERVGAEVRTETDEKFARRRDDALFARLENVSVWIWRKKQPPKGGEWKTRKDGSKYRVSTLHFYNTTPFKEALEAAKAHPDYAKRPRQLRQEFALKISDKYFALTQAPPVETGQDVGDGLNLEVAADKSMVRLAARYRKAWEMQELPAHIASLRRDAAVKNFEKLMKEPNPRKRKQKYTKKEHNKAGRKGEWGDIRVPPLFESQPSNRAGLHKESQIFNGDTHEMGIVDSLLEDEAERF